MISYDTLCSYENLEKAFYRARKHKTLKPYVIEFEKNLKENLLQLQKELQEQSYTPKPLVTFILRDPKTRKISKSDFRDRVIHHAICNLIEPIFDKTFIYDSYANRMGKGTLNAIKRFDCFKKKVSKNNTQDCFVLKADIKHYFENVDHEKLLEIIKRKITDEKISWLIKKILENHKTEQFGKGMPLGNLTSQFFANLYLNELDQYIKHELKAEYYIRYVDDFVILSNSIDELKKQKDHINDFLKEKLSLELHPEKSQISPIEKGIGFLGFRIFYHHKLIKKKNIYKIEKTFRKLKEEYNKTVTREKVIEQFEGWITYISNANTYKYRRHLARRINSEFPITQPIQNIKKHENNLKRTKNIETLFSHQKTKQLFLKNNNIKQIAEKRSLKEGTIWQHLAQLIENHQLSIQQILSKEKIREIRKNIYKSEEPLKEIKARIGDKTITYDEIACVQASIKAQNQKKNILFHSKWYQNNHCRRKCYSNPKQKKECKEKFNLLISQNPNLEITRKQFLELFNNHMMICALPEIEKKKYLSWQEFQKTKKK